MENVYSFLNSKIRGRDIDSQLRILQFIVFNNYYKILYLESTGKEKLTVSGREILITGKINNIVKLLYANTDKYCDTAFPEYLKRQYRLIDGKLRQIPFPPREFLSNISNSCAIDSLLSVILFTSSAYFTRLILESGEGPYPKWIDSESIIRLSRIVKTDILKLYNSTTYTNAAEIQRNLTNFIAEDCRDVKAVYELWNVLCTMYNRLPIKLLTNRDIEIGNSPTEYYSIPITELDKLDEIVDLPNHLVVLNDSIIHKYTFDEIDGYDLIGVILHTGNHYISRIRIYEEWYEYDDLNSNIRNINTNVLIQEGYRKNVMFFYIKSL